MHLTAPDRVNVLRVAERAMAIEQSSRDPREIVDTVMVQEAVVAWHDDQPVAVLGVFETEPGEWTMYCFHTEHFGKVITGLTRFIKRFLIPGLFDERGARRIEGSSPVKNIAIHRWMELCGAKREGTRGDSVVYAIVAKPLDKPDVA